MVTLEEITKAYFKIQKHVYKTPLVYSDILSSLSGAKVYIKLENLQKSGSFKIRGVLNKALNLANSCGLHFVTASSGNHGYGVAFIAKQLNYSATVVVPVYTPKLKIDLIKSQGANLVLAGNSWDESFLVAQEIALRKQAILISPVGDPDIIAGYGTITLEIFEELSTLPDYFFCSIGSGSMIAGNGIAIKALSPKTQVIGFQTYGADAMFQSLKSGNVKELASIKSIVEGFAIKRVDEETFNIVKKTVDSIYRYTDKECTEAALFMLENTNMLLELSASICIAPLLNKSFTFKPTDSIVVILCGGNNDLQRLTSSLINKKGIE